jgi:trehalose 6-phosphate phosphatase
VKEPKYLFNHLEELEEFKNDNKTSIITDIDGTISKIVPTPMEATVSQDMRNTIEKLLSKYPLTGVVTGRSIENAFEMLEIKELIYIGNHGLEYLKNGEIHIDSAVEKYVPLIKELAREIKAKLKDKDCILFQDKGLSFTVHYRLCDDADKIREIALDIISKLEESKHLKIAEGRKVIEIRPPIGHDKGTIIEKLILENNIKKIVYLGDDITDADAFSKLNELNRINKVKSINIVVSSKETPDFVKQNADFYVKNIVEIQKFFYWLIDD